MEIVAAGVEPLRELIGAMHSKLLLAELRRHAPGVAPASVALRARRRARPRYQSARWCSTTPQPVRELDAARQRAGERAERRPVVAADEQHVLAAAALGLGVEAQRRAVGAADLREVRRRTATGGASCGTPSTHTARSQPLGGSLTPLTRFHASARAVGALRRRPALQHHSVTRA